MNHREQTGPYGERRTQRGANGHTRRRMPRAPTVIAAAALMACSAGAFAANPTLEFLGPSEWSLPVINTPGKIVTANIFMQTVFTNTNDDLWDARGDSVDTPTTHGVFGLTRFAQFLNFGQPKWLGMAWEYLQPEVSVSGKGTSVSGLGDPLIAYFFYMKPTPNTTIGYVPVFSVPVGSNELSNHFWYMLNTFIGDVNVGPFELDGTIAFGSALDHRNADGIESSIGASQMSDVRASYQVTPKLRPFIGADYQHIDSADVRSSFTGDGLPMPMTTLPGQSLVMGCAGPGSCQETVGDVGLKFNFTPTLWLTGWYTRGLAGHNTERTNGVYFRFVAFL